jgi:L-amino acid N-acyltransferase YncA
MASKRTPFTRKNTIKKPHAIRPAVFDDVPAILRIYNQSIVERIATADTEPRTLEDRQQWFEQFDSRYPLWVGVQDGQVVSYGNLLSYSPKDGYRHATENSVYVAQEARGRGLGRAMLEHLLIEAKRLEFHYMIARIFSHNEISIHLHTRLGFRELGLQKKIVRMDEKWFDVLLMDRLI